MAKGRQLQAQRRRRRKRLARAKGRRAENISFPPDLTGLVTQFPAGPFPGAAHPSLERPDVAKYRLGAFVQRHPAGASRLAELERRFKNGPLGFVPGIDHWATEEFLYHGLPDDDWNPIDAFLEENAAAFPEPAGEQLRQWKQAQLGVFKIGPVRDHWVELTPWDPLQRRVDGAAIRAISLSMGGAGDYRKCAGMATACYVAPWSPGEEVFCAMGYSDTLPEDDAAWLIPTLALRHPAAVARPWPWNGEARPDYLAQWRRRDWGRWLEARLEFPFTAMVPASDNDGAQVAKIVGFQPATLACAREFGIYLKARGAVQVGVCGATTVIPTDVTSANMAALEEYRAYRDEAGPPPGAPLLEAMQDPHLWKLFR